MKIKIEKWLRKLAIVFLLMPLFCVANENMKEVDLTLLNERGMLMRVLTDGRPIWVAYRTKKALARIKERSHISYPTDPETIDREYRSHNKDYFVVFGGCPEGDELPAYYPDKGFVCQSNCAEFDMAGRPINNCAGEVPMKIPVHYFKDEETIIVPMHQDGNT